MTDQEEINERWRTEVNYNSLEDEEEDEEDEDEQDSDLSSSVEEEEEEEEEEEDEGEEEEEGGGGREEAAAPGFPYVLPPELSEKLKTLGRRYEAIFREMANFPISLTATRTYNKLKKFLVDAGFRAKTPDFFSDHKGNTGVPYLEKILNASEKSVASFKKAKELLAPFEPFRGQLGYDSVFNADKELRDAIAGKKGSQPYLSVGRKARKLIIAITAYQKENPGSPFEELEQLKTHQQAPTNGQVKAEKKPKRRRSRSKAKPKPKPKTKPKPRKKPKTHATPVTVFEEKPRAQRQRAAAPPAAPPVDLGAFLVQQAQHYERTEAHWLELIAAVRELKREDTEQVEAPRYQLVITMNDGQKVFPPRFFASEGEALDWGRNTYKQTAVDMETRRL